MKLRKNKINEFQETIWNYYAYAGREFAWRSVNDPYKILVSEIMLQQTQTFRVIHKYEQFISAFPNIKSLASASLRNVLSAWSGLGYNRRGMYLKQCAELIVQHHNSVIPNDPAVLVSLPGIGKATAASICAFAFNCPTLFIETNIRTVFIHCFYNEKNNVDDKELIPLVEQTLDKENPREWYYALMDYGVMLKKMIPNPSRKSKHHVKQSKFEGSDRQIRGMILRELTTHESIDLSELMLRLQEDQKRIHKIINQMCKDGLLKKSDDTLKII